MTDYSWDESHLIGIISIDDEHEALFSTLTSWLKHLLANEAQPSNGEIKDLYNLWNKHFHHEEILLEKYNYPGLDKQKADHVMMEKKIRQFVSKATNGPISITDVEALLKMFTAHTMGPDMAYGEYLKGEGVR